MKPNSYIILIIVLVGAGTYYFFQDQIAQEQEIQIEKTEPLQTPEAEIPENQHPLPEPRLINDDTDEESLADAEMEKPLPTLEESDNRIKEIISSIFDNDLVNQIIQQTGILHRFVLTVDTLPLDIVPIKYRLFPSSPGKFLVQNNSNSTIILDSGNYARYHGYIQLLDNLDTELFVKWYTRFYPLIQEEYGSLGYKNRYFNDRFIFVIDHLLVTPEVTDPIELTQPSVFYHFADPTLQKLSAGQKILLRIGPANRKIVKAKLTEIREALVKTQ